MISVYDLPAVNATLNGIATVLLVIGYTFIRRRNIQAHKRTMIAAFATSILFLACYLVYHFNVLSRKYAGPPGLRTIYFGILGTHVLLAATVPFLSIITLNRAFRARYQKHRQIARWTFPIWLYVSITGVVVYLMLYQL